MQKEIEKMAKLGIQAIEMYCSMVREQFAPLLSELRSREHGIKENLEIHVKKDLGIYNLYVKKAKLKVELEETERQLKGWETKTHTPMGYVDPIEERVNVLLRKSRNGIAGEVRKEMNDMIFAIKLSGLDADTKSVFDKLPGVIGKLTNKVNKLPAPNLKKLLK